MRHLFILVPSLHPAGPVKGAVALVNALADMRKITLVHLKPGPGVDAPLDGRASVVSLAHEVSFREKLARYRKLLLDAGGRERVVSLSFCFSADMVNLFCRREAVTGASVRGNLLRNYRLDYGLHAIPFAIAHLTAMRGFDHVVVMTGAMAEQVQSYAGQRPTVIGNFVDEAPLERYCRMLSNEGPLRFVFLASLTQRKQPLVLLNALYELHRGKEEVRLDIIGEGPMRKQMEVQIAKRGLGDSVVLHGHLSVPYDLVVQADALVLPSSSEGISRASLEAMHLGVPCVLRYIDGNDELVRSGENGALFKRDEELASVMREVALWSRNRNGVRESLLPPSYRQSAAAKRYLALMESKA